ncbi:ABC transporter ATP-binding protein [Paenibacillus elgii]|uniref:ABC transporter ATP-binding protein n=1 Tax=Paenibacillus elgii TaxID=189691 RepID=A0A2T6G4J8_9BACL|nr:ABC transporter ATP-binding protein [Paenibacillus elgii]PUA39097.1 ABC transporter ATP-binding protein [Paenibacillus elgii]
MELLIDNVGKRYGRQHWAVKRLNLRLKPGVVGLLGPNGAGKSSLMRILATISRPTEGRVLWNGEDTARKPDRLRKTLGYLPQDFGVYPNLNAVEFLSYIAALKGITGRSAHRRIEGLLELVNLTEACRRPVGSYSGGMKQRVGIAQALLNDPELLIVDEPTVGLDPEERIRFRNLLSDLAGERIVLFSTHIVSDIEAAATEIAVMQKGELLSYASPEAMLRGMENKVWEVVIPDRDLQEVRQRWRISGSIRRTDGLQLRVVAERQPVPEAKPIPPALEDAYLYLISSQAEEANA